MATCVEKLIEIYNRLEDAGLMVIAGKKDSAELMVSNDVVPVVRCKECMWARPKDHREPTETPRDFICQCSKHHYIPAPWHARMAVKADDFCSYGERKPE